MATVSKTERRSAPPWKSAAIGLFCAAVIIIVFVASRSSDVEQTVAVPTGPHIYGGNSPPPDVDPVFEKVWQTAIARGPREGAIPIVSGPLADIDYDGYRKIIFDPDKQFWKGDDLGWILDLFHAGYIFKEPVRVWQVLSDSVADSAAAPAIGSGDPTVEANAERQPEIKPIAFDPDLFWYLDDVVKRDQIPEQFGYAGIRLNSIFQGEESYREVASFLGATYFRALGSDHIYGSSARGLAIDTASNMPEQFPSFREYWVERPKPDAERVRAWALLDSAGITGAYRFDIYPGDTTRLDVTARLKARHQIGKLCIAPITSMFMWGDGTPPPSGDSRPEVHDADGLLCWSESGEWLWRPLRCPSTTTRSVFEFDGLRGFGLLQRDQSYDNYRDDEALYHRRYSIWVEPKQSLGRGRVELLEIESPGEWIDNIAAFWVPERPILADDVIDLKYDLLFCSGNPPAFSGGRVLSSSVTYNAKQDVAKVMLTFGGGGLDDSARDRDFDVLVTPKDRLIAGPLVRRAEDGTIVAVFDLQAGTELSGEARACLVSGKDFLSETWSYRCQP
ncbi:glucan biosynthesis protein [Stratiformator vulcanicus]|uniref:Glucans biosynthesis protein G n=1 Tax=Stratiformator vulcanicus TaxID=2527980 RepID=A0A517QWA7_9PLAN|nr:glucan biosynthesis protein [Stratiformator vulcanicus]QDT35949.1 Glucans biosynthesis protein G precursor [Stratiformator vulcanicus]